MPNEPVRAAALIDDDQPANLVDGIGLCLSGGGYRAMLFHLGALWYLNDASLLGTIQRCSSVSGGSITAGILGQQWASLNFTNGKTASLGTVVDAVRELARRTLDRSAILGGIFSTDSIGEELIEAYDDHVFHGSTLQSLPDTPRFVINATNVQSGALFRFSKPYVWDYRVGKIDHPTLLLAAAVAASSAFPPVLSPVTLDLSRETFEPKTGKDLQFPPYTTHVVLTDGGVYDNLGLETVFKRYRTVLVSDGGGHIQAEPVPKDDWARHALRVNGIIDNQVRSLRKRELIDAYQSKDPVAKRSGAYWGMWTLPSEYEDKTLHLPDTAARDLANTPTRLAKMPDALQERLINYGYGMAARAVRSYYQPNAFLPNQFPYPRGIQ